MAKNLDAIAQMERAFADSSMEGKPGAVPVGSGLDINEQLKKTLTDISESVKTRHAARTVAELTREDGDVPGPDPLGILGQLKEVGLIDPGQASQAFRGTTDMMGRMIVQQSVEAQAAREESRSDRDALLKLVLATLADNSSRGVRETQELIRKLTENRTDPVVGKLQEVMGDAMAAIFAKTLNQQAGPQPSPVDYLNHSLQQVEAMNTLVDRLLQKREREVRPVLSPDGGPIQSVEVVKLLMQDELERWKITRQEQRQDKDADSRDRTMRTFEKIAEDYKPLVMQFLLSRQQTAAQAAGQGQPQGQPASSGLEV